MLSQSKGRVNIINNEVKLNRIYPKYVHNHS